MTTLVTFPGRNGDLLWALPTLRAIAERTGPVDLQVANEFTTLVDLLQHQPYLGKVWADPRWNLVPPREWDAPVVEGYDRVIHAGYRGWPEACLPAWTELCVKTSYPDLVDLQVDYETPWITVPAAIPAKWNSSYQIISGWSDEWFELKFGLVKLLGRGDLGLICQPGGRWDTEAMGLPIFPCRWVEAAQWIQQGRLFFGCCSALHVLAVAMGIPVLIVEPNPARENPIFYPFGMTGRVTVVKGLDGGFTHDARHTADALEGT